MFTLRRLVLSGTEGVEGNLSSIARMSKTKSKNILEDVRQWFFKIRYLKNQISSIEKIEGIPVLTISVFLLKSQLVEFEIKQLITALDQHLFFSNGSEVVNVIPRTPSFFDEKIFTLGALIEEMKRYNSPKVKDVLKELNELNGLRRQFTHKLFNVDKKLGEVNSESKRGIVVANTVLRKIEELEKFLHENDPLNLK